MRPPQWAVKLLREADGERVDLLVALEDLNLADWEGFLEALAWRTKDHYLIEEAFEPEAGTDLLPLVGACIDQLGSAPIRLYGSAIESLLTRQRSHEPAQNAAVLVLLKLTIMTGRGPTGGVLIGIARNRSKLTDVRQAAASALSDFDTPYDSSFWDEIDYRVDSFLLPACLSHYSTRDPAHALHLLGVYGPGYPEAARLHPPIAAAIRCLLAREGIARLQQALTPVPPLSRGLVEAVLDREEFRRVQLRERLMVPSEVPLSSDVSRDIESFLAAAASRSQLLLDELSPGDPRRHDVRRIQAVISQAAALTQPLAFKRQKTVQPRLLNLNDIVGDNEMVLQRVLGEGITLVTELEPALATISGDAGRVEEALFNMAVNAREAMPHGGRLTIATANVELTEPAPEGNVRLEPGRYVRLDVSVTSPGMDEQDLQRVFDRGFTTKGRDKGTGVGLAIVYRIVKESGGQITLSSEPGHGTRLKMFFPHAEVPAVRQGPLSAVSGSSLLYHSSWLEAQGRRDPLTGCLDQQALADALEAELDRARRYELSVSLLLVDIDRFKGINDAYGHVTGDSVLLQIGEILRREVRSMDIVARRAGEEFVVLMPQTGVEGAVTLAERLRKSVEGHDFGDPSVGPLQLTVSIGIVSYPDDEVKNAEMFLRRADQALYRRKGDLRDTQVDLSGLREEERLMDGEQG